MMQDVRIYRYEDNIRCRGSGGEPSGVGQQGKIAKHLAGPHSRYLLPVVAGCPDFHVDFPGPDQVDLVCGVTLPEYSAS